MLKWNAAPLVQRNRGGTLIHDIVISGATILDGTGSPAFAGDVAIESERIVAVGGKPGRGRRVIDAAGHGQDAGDCPARLVRTGR
jgi:adenine deaminase